MDNLQENIKFDDKQSAAIAKAINNFDEIDEYS